MTLPLGAAGPKQFSEEQVGKRNLPRAARTAACVEVPRPWHRRGRRGVSVTIIVIEVLRVSHGDVLWEQPLESVLGVAVGLLALDTISETARAVARVLRRMVPDRMELERRNGKRRLAFGW